MKVSWKADASSSLEPPQADSRLLPRLETVSLPGAPSGPSSSRGRKSASARERSRVGRAQRRLMKYQALLDRDSDPHSPEVQEALEALNNASGVVCQKHRRGACGLAADCPFWHGPLPPPPRGRVKGALHTWYEQRGFGFIRGPEGIDYYAERKELPADLDPENRPFPIPVSFAVVVIEDPRKHDAAVSIHDHQSSKAKKAFAARSKECPP